MRKLLALAAVAAVGFATTGTAHANQIEWPSHHHHRSLVVRLFESTSAKPALRPKPALRQMPILTQFIGAPAQWSLWAAQSQVMMPAAAIRYAPESMCDGNVSGCSDPVPNSDGSWDVYATDEDSFYFEMGHISDWTMLTWPDRGFVAGKLGQAAWHWTDDNSAVQSGVEDGLEGDYAELFDLCANGLGGPHLTFSLAVSGTSIMVPTVSTGDWNVCQYINRLGIVSLDD